MNTHISSYAHVYGQHDYSAKPFVPIGMESLFHDKPQRQWKFAEHYKKGFVLGMSFEHYRGWKMWMINTLTTRISNTVFQKHKYISNPTVTPGDAFIAASQHLAAALKSKMPQYLQESPFSELSRLSKIFSDAAAVPKQNGAPFSAAIPEQAGAVNPQQPGLPASPPIPRTRYIQKELDASPRHHQQPHNVTLFLQPVAPTPPAPRVNAPRLHPVPPPRVLPRISARLAVAAPRVDPHQPAPQVTTTQHPTGPDARTRSKNTDFCTVAQEAIFLFATLNLLNLSHARLAGRCFPLKMLNSVLNK